jgi:acyl dehydratase
MNTYDSLKVGSELAPLVLQPIDRTMLALFAGASGDHNPVHIDLDFARKAGMPDVFAQGMLGMAWLGRLLTSWVPQAQLRQFNVRFAGITHLGHVITCSGTVVEKRTEGDRRLAKLEIRTTNQYGETKIAGDALLSF